MPIIEQRLIGAKKDPDQEALEHAILISKQEEEFGVNMYDALLDEDEPVVEEYMAQGFTREEAILIIFEERFGKVSIYQQSRITPAMPTLHKLEGVQAQEVNPEDEPEIEYLMTKGYTREQAIEVMFTQRRKAEERRQEEERRRQRELERQYFPQASQGAAPSNHSGRHHDEYGMDVYDSYGVQGSQTNSRRGTMHQQQSHAAPQPNYEDDEEMQELLRLGYTHEQALAVVMAHRLADEDDGVGGGAGGAMTSTMDEDAALAQELAAEEEYMEENAEVAYLMSRGYTREQAIQVAETNQRTRAAALAAAAVTTTTTTTSAGGVSDRELETLMNQGYTREQATQVLLLRSTGGNASSSANRRPTATASLASTSYEDYAHGTATTGLASSSNGGGSGGRSSVYRASALMDQFSPATEESPGYGHHSRGSTYNIGGGHGGGSSYYDSAREGSTSYYESTITSSDAGGAMGGGLASMPPPPRGPHALSPEEEQMERVLLISQQEAEFGVNMYDSITPADGPEVEQMIAMGYSEFEALQWIFDRRFRNGPGQLQAQQAQQQQQLQAQLQQQQLLQQQQQAQQQQQQQAQQQQLLLQQQQQLLLQQQQAQQQAQQQMLYGSMSGSTAMMYDGGAGQSMYGGGGMMGGGMLPEDELGTNPSFYGSSTTMSGYGYAPSQSGGMMMMGGGEGQPGYRRFSSSVYRVDGDGDEYYDEEDDGDYDDGHHARHHRSSSIGGHSGRHHRRNSSLGGGASVSGNTIHTVRGR